MNEQHVNALSRGYRIQEYELVRVLGFGGFGLTYLGFDHHLDKAVAIKEYLPSEIATRISGNSIVPQASTFREDFEWGLERFLDEAQTLAHFKHPNLIQVHRFFEAHGTAYIVMEYAEGETLSAFLERKGTLTEGELKAILLPLLDGLEVVHRENFLHRDIKPGNIIIRDEDGSPVLLDFGSARQAIGAKSRSVTAVVTPGYAPIEQYSMQGDQGPWTDLYALGGVCYRALTGRVPEDSTDRTRRDPLVPLGELCGDQVSAATLDAISWALQVDEEARPQSVAAWRAALAGEAVAATPRSAETVLAPASVPGAGAPRLRRRKGVGAALGVGLLLAGMGWYWAERQAEVARQEAEVARQEQQAAAEETHLLAGAEAALGADRLDEAWEKYQEVLARKPDHGAAKAGRERVLGRYKVLFDAALAGGNFGLASSYMESIRGLLPDAPVLGALSRQLAAAQAAAEHQREVEAARQAEEERQRQAAAAQAALERQRQAEVARQAEVVRQRKAKELEGRLGLHFVWIEPGTFWMGSPGVELGRDDDESPVHEVAISEGFWLGKYEVTQGQWEAVMGTTPWSGEWGVVENPSHPAAYISWHDVQAFIGRLNDAAGDSLYRLPSEAEWEYACRAGTSTPWSFGDDQSQLMHYAWYGANACSEGACYAHAVGMLRPNGWGLHEMHGNVWEWVQDWYDSNHYNSSARLDPLGPTSGSVRVLRGGSFADAAQYLRAAFRHRYDPTARYGYFGVRLLRLR